MTARRVPALLLLLAPLAGCYAPLQTPPARGALEQQVIAEAIRAAVDRLDLDALGLSHDLAYEVSVRGLVDTDRQWVQACLEERLARNKIPVSRGAPERGPRPGAPQRSLPAGASSTDDARETPPEAVTRLEVVVAYAGNDLEKTLIGFPLFVPGVPVALGSLSLYDASTTTGRARLGLRAWDGQRLVRTLPEVQESRYHRSMTFLTFLGPFRSTDMATWEEPGSESHEEQPRDTESADEEAPPAGERDAGSKEPN